jgi:hypothetical protein
MTETEGHAAMRMLLVEYDREFSKDPEALDERSYRERSRRLLVLTAKISDLRAELGYISTWLK